jgi:hypothetical protein
MAAAITVMRPLTTKPFRLTPHIRSYRAPAPDLFRWSALAAALLLGTPSLRAASWEPQQVPAAWEGLATTSAWYRCYIRVPDNMTSRAEVDLWTDSAMISLADLPGPFTLLLNGETIAEGGAVAPPARRRFKIPKGILEKQSFNVLALHLEGESARVGLRAAPIVHGYLDELVLEGVADDRLDRHAQEAAGRVQILNRDLGGL